MGDPALTNDPLLGRLMGVKKKDVVHSSAYGKAQNAEGIGTASAQSFRARMAADESRSFVERYKDSQVMHETRNRLTGPQVYDGEKKNEARAEMTQRFAGSAGGPSGGSSAGAGGRTAGAPPVRRNPGISR